MSVRELLQAPRGSRRVDHALFLVAQVLLALVAVWWFVVLAHATGTEARLQRQVVELEARTHALGLAGRPSLEPGPLPEHPSYQVAPLARSPGAASIPGTTLGVEPTPDMREELDRRLARRRLMVFGEGSLLLLLVGTCFGMLWRLVLAERRYRRDIEGFMARVTHEMKTPLAGLKALLQTLREGRVPEERRREIAEMGLRQAEREEHLIENLLTAHRIAIGAQPAALGEVDLPALLAEFADHRERTTGFGRERLDVECPAGLAVRANAAALLTILENLADNAFKYGARRVHVVASRDGASAVRLAVRDDGAGFAPGAGEALFGAWTRGAAAPTGAHGTGLGLSIARSLAREMGGELSAESEGPGRGSTFTLRLSAAERAAA